MEILFELCDVSSKCITSWEMTAEKYSRCQFGFILHLCTCSYLLLKVCLSQFWREVFFSSLPHLAMRKRWNCGCDSWVWCKPGGSPAVWDGDGHGCSECFGGVFSVWALAMVLLCHQKCLRCHRTAWMGSALAWLVFTALRPRECCFWSFLTHISASSPFASLFPSSCGRLSTGTENFTSWSPGMLLGIIIIEEQNKISGC